MPPLGNLLNIETYYDSQITRTETARIHCGVINENILLNVSDLLLLAQPNIADITMVNS